MKFVAFEVSINGDRKYSVGSDNWQHLSANLIGHHIDPSRFSELSEADKAELPSEPYNHLQLTALVSVSGKDIQITDPEGHVYTKSKTGSYPACMLSPGDVVEIRIIETDEADSPRWENLDPRFPGRAIFRADSDPE